MKTIKKILLGTAALALFTFASCGKQLGDPSVEIKGSTGKASIEHTNETDGTQRAMKIYNTKHYDTNCAFVIENQESTSYDGQLGYTFCLDKNSDGSYNFATVGFRYDGRAGKKYVDTYISFFYNIKEDEFSTDNFGVVDVYGSGSGKKAPSTFNVATVKGNGTATEYEVAVLPTVLDGFAINSDKQVIGAISITADDNGGYSVKYFKESKLTKTTDKNGKITRIVITDGAAADKTINVPATVTGLTKKTQTQLGVYAGIYTNSTLTGSWWASDLEGNPIPAEFEN